MKRCGKCGYLFKGEGELCANCTNGHTGNRITLEEAFDEIEKETDSPKEDKDE